MFSKRMNMGFSRSRRGPRAAATAMLALVGQVNGFTISSTSTKAFKYSPNKTTSIDQNEVSCSRIFGITSSLWVQSSSFVSTSRLGMAPENGSGDDWFDDYDEIMTPDKRSSAASSSYGNNQQSQFDDSRSFYGGGGGGGGRGRRQEPRRNFSGGHDYMRHPEDGSSTSVDVKAVNDMLSERLECRKTGNFDRADQLRDILRDQMGVYVWDKERIWTTNPNNSRGGGGGGGGRRGGRESRFSPGGGRGRGGRNPRFSEPPRQRPPRDFGPNGHDYEQAGDGIDPSVCTMSEDEIHQLLAQRLQYKMSRTFHKADDIQLQLESQGVTVHDGAKQWRADGLPFDMAKAGPIRSNRRDDVPYTFRQRRGEEIALDEAALDEISQQVELRSQAKRNRDYQSADDIKEYLQSRYNVTIDDRNKIWYVRSETYVMSPQSEEPSDLKTVQDMVDQRWEAKKAQNYDLADEIRDQLRTEYGVTIDDRMKEFTYVPLEQRKRPEVMDPWTETANGNNEAGEDDEFFSQLDDILEDKTGESTIEENTNEEDDETMTEEVEMANGEQEEDISLELLEALTVPQLKEKLKEAGLPVSGTKAILIERLTSSLAP